ncbi:MAG TPA: DNA polymerase I [Phycisphaerales bacterium]|nr:DNA polymerase I [Phycisphaerales bacterium]HMP37766.1 DNA polymerase I [Phycisphaerales bacterium]
MSEAEPVLYVIDGHAQFFRAYHAIRSGLRSPVTGEPTNLVFGFVSMILRLLRDRKPEHLAVVIDAAGDTETFRSQLDPQYKANRDPPPQDFRPQVERCLEILAAMRIPVLAEPGVEADDVIATLVRRLRRERPDLRIRIVSKDKDLGQLLDEQVELFDVHTDAALTVEELFERRGVSPAQVVEMLALMGDSSDNIPGVPGIGPKTAAELIVRYGSIAGLLEHLDELTPKRRESIERTRARLPLNVELVRLRDDLPLAFDLEASRIDDRWREALPLAQLEGIFKDLAFQRLLGELAQVAGRAAERPQPSRSAPLGPAAEADAGGVAPGVLGGVDEGASAGAGGARSDARSGGTSDAAAERRGRGRARATAAAGPSLFSAPAADAPALSADTLAGDYAVLRSAAEVAAFVAEAASAAVVAVDTETDALSPIDANLCGISLSIAEGRGVYVPIRSPEPQSHLGLDEVVAIVRPLLEGERPAKCGHNLKFDGIVLQRHGIALGGVETDTLVASYLVDATRPGHGLDALARGLLRHECTPIESVIGAPPHERRFDEAPLSIAGPYAAEDADIALRLRDRLLPEVDALGLRRLHDEVEIPLVEVLAAMELNGIRVDRDELARQRTALAGRIDGLRRRIVEAAPHPFSPDSPKQLAAVLFNRPGDDPPGLGIAVVRRNKTGPSTDQEVLDRLAADPAIDSEIPKLIVEYRQLTKLVGTYLIALDAAVNRRTGRVHASFHQTVAATGRLASSDPNLQNIPIRSDVGRAIRRAFVADDGHLLLAVDYSQIELRLLAHLSGDPALIEAFRAGADIHAAVAAEVFGTAPADVTDEQRSTAKMVNFGIVYGITAFGLARRLGPGTSNERAAQIIADYKARFARIDAFLASCVAFAREHGHVETILRRRRPIPQVHSRNPQERALGERMAINTVVQGSAADLIKVAMVDLHRVLGERHPRVRILLQIHDELVFEVPEGEIDAVRALVIERMEQAMPLDVPLVAQAGQGRDWSQT